MIDLNKINNFSGEEKYDLAEVAKILNLGFGRNTLYQILKELEIVNEHNVPADEFQKKGLLELVVPFLRPNPMFVNHPKTLVIGEKGFEFIRETVIKYLENNPVPRQNRSKRN